MTANIFVKFVHRVQDIINLNKLASEEERKSNVDMDWIWKDLNQAEEIEPLQAVQVLPPPALPVQPRL